MKIDRPLSVIRTRVMSAALLLWGQCSPFQVLIKSLFCHRMHCSRQRRRRRREVRVPSKWGIWASLILHSLGNKSLSVASIKIKNVYLTCRRTLTCRSPRLLEPLESHLTPDLTQLNFRKNSILLTAANPLSRKTFSRFRTANEATSSTSRVISIQVRSLETTLAKLTWARIMLFTLTTLIIRTTSLELEMRTY